MRTFQKMVTALWMAALPVMLFSAQPKISKELLSSTYSSGVTTLDWVVRLDTNGTQTTGPVRIIDSFSSAQSYLSSTETHPNGWSATQNPNEFVWSHRGGDGAGYRHDFPEQSLETRISGEGDGFAPIPYTALNGDKRFYYLNHLATKNATSFGCFGSCGNSSWPKQLLDGDPGSSDTSATPNAPETAILNRKLYYPVTRSGDSGIGCYDLENDTECGYIQLSVLGRSGTRSISIDGLQNIGSSLYIMDGNGVVYKVNVDSSGAMSLAGSVDLSSSGLTFNEVTMVTSPLRTAYGISSEQVNGKIYFSKGDNTASNRKIICYDSVTQGLCSGWSGAVTVTSLTQHDGINTFVHYNSSMSADGICVSKSSAYGAQQCFDLNNGSPLSLPDVQAFQNGNGFETVVGTKTYFSDIYTNKLYVYDWSSSTAGVPIIKAGTKLYGSALDENGCLWMLGHNSILWSVDPQTDQTPCQRNDTFVIEDTYDASKNWCASEDVQWRYTVFQINGLRPGMFADLNVTFYDASGNIILQTSLPTNAISHSQSLFTAPFQPGEPIHYKIEGLYGSNANPNWAPPVITIGVEGPPKEFCFKTTVPCPVTGEIRNDVTLQVDGQQVDQFSVSEDAQQLCHDAMPEPKQCLNAEPVVKCTPVGWTVELGGFTPSSYNASNTRMQVLSPNGATATKWGSTWYLNGVSAGDTVQLSMQGVQQGAGKGEGNDLCCDGETNVTIPQESCEVEQPHIYVRKSYDEDTHIFDLNVRIMNTIYPPQVLSVSDTLPAGITITGIAPVSASEWICTNTFPVSGPAVVNCFYTGAMPVSGVKDLLLTSVVNTATTVENCADSGVVGTDGVSVYTNAMMHHCIEVNATQENNDTTEGCQTDAECPNGYCHEGLCINGSPDSDISDDNVTDENESCPNGQIMVNGVCEPLPDDPCGENEQMVDGHCMSVPPFSCSSNIILVVDKSYSIKEAGAQSQVKNMLHSFLSRYRGNGSKAAIITFATTASIDRTMTLITPANTYPSYTVTSNGLTNWEDALVKAQSIASAGDIIFFITDGQPNQYIDDNNGNITPSPLPITPSATAALEATATNQAAVVASQIKAMGVRIVPIGVGSLSSSPTAVAHLNQIASKPSDIAITDFDNLDATASDYAAKGCPNLVLTKEFLYGTPQYDGCRRVLIGDDPGTNKIKLTVQNTTATSVSGVTIRDVLPLGLSAPANFVPSLGTASATGNTISWNISTLGANAQETLTFEVVQPAIALPSVGDFECQTIHNYTEITSATGYDVTPLMADAQNGPVNQDAQDEATACLKVCRSNYQSPPCDPATDGNHCLHVYKFMLGGEGNCAPGNPCRYKIQIYNTAATAYTATLNISDTMIPTGASSPVTVTPQGSAPDPMCTPVPTAVPFSCTQTADIPPNTSWSYEVLMQTTPQDAIRNTLTVNNQTVGFDFSTSNRMAAVPVPPEPQLTVTKSAPKMCVAGERCTFTLKVTNNAKQHYKGPLSIADRSKEFVGRLLKTTGKGWKCRTTRKGYVCNNPEITLKSGESSILKLTVRIPNKAKGYLHNCAKLDGLRGSNRIRALQTVLLEKGFDPNGIDGGMGRGTKRALNAYMKSKGLKGKQGRKKAMQELVSQYPAPVSKNSCVKVKIKQVCQKDEKRVGDTCKPRCKKWQHWNGKRCVTCEKGTKWDKRKKRCTEPKCPKGTMRHQGKCIKVTKKENKSERPKCIPLVTHYNELLGICVPNISIGIGGGGGGKSSEPVSQPHYDGI